MPPTIGIIEIGMIEKKIIFCWFVTYLCKFGIVLGKTGTGDPLVFFVNMNNYHQLHNQLGIIIVIFQCHVSFFNHNTVSKQR